MAVYIILLIFILLLSIIPIPKNTKGNYLLYILFAVIPLVFVSAFRSHNVGVDAQAYVILFDFLKGMSINEILKLDVYYEKGYLILNHIIQYLSMENQSILIVTSLIIVCLILIFIYKYSTAPAFSVYLFMTLTFYYSSMNIVRQYIAIAILLLSIKYVIQRKLIPFISIVFIASLFHSSALIFCIVYLFPIIKFSIKKVCYIIVFSIIVTLVLTPIMELVLIHVPQYQEHISYLDSNKLASVIKSLVLFAILFLGLLIKYSQNQSEKIVIQHKNVLEAKKIGGLNEKNIYNSEETVISFIMLTAVAISIISVKMSILGRLSDYFAIFSVIYIPNVINRIQSREIKMIVIFLVVTFTILYNAIIFIYRPEWYQVTPYSLFK